MSGNLFTPGGDAPEPVSQELGSSASHRNRTRAGPLIEPKTDFLREALCERPASKQRTRSSTPRRPRVSLQPNAIRDEWLHTSSSEASNSRRPRARRQSDLGSTTSSNTSTNDVLGARETEGRISKLENQNWDLKHRIALQEQRSKELREMLDAKEEELERTRDMRERNESLTKQVASFEKQVEELEDEQQQLQEERAEYTSINDDLVKELERRDRYIEELTKGVSGDMVTAIQLKEDQIHELTEQNVRRQAAIEEAAGIIKDLEKRIEELCQTKPILGSITATPCPQGVENGFSTRPDAGQAGINSPHVVKPPRTSHSIDSDYFSADPSPQATPKHVRRTSIPVINREAEAAKASQTTMSFNRELGIKSITSKDSLLQVFLEDPSLAPAKPSTPRPFFLRSLRRNTTSKSSEKVSRSPSPNRTEKPGSNGRHLRNLYMSGELGLQIHNSTPPRPPNLRSDSSSRESSGSPEDLAVYSGSKSRSASSLVPTAHQPSPRSNSFNNEPGPPASSHARSSSFSRASRSHSATRAPQTTPRRASRRRPEPAKSDDGPAAHSSSLCPSPSPASHGPSTPTTTTTTTTTRSTHNPLFSLVTQKLTPKSASKDPHRARADHTPKPRSGSSAVSKRNPTPAPSLPASASPAATPPTSKSPRPPPPSSSSSSSASSSPPTSHNTPVVPYSATKLTTQTHKRSPPARPARPARPAPDFNAWPRRYPAWPPSAALANRDLLYHEEEGVDESP